MNVGPGQPGKNAGERAGLVGRDLPISLTSPTPQPSNALPKEPK